MHGAESLWTQSPDCFIALLIGAAGRGKWIGDALHVRGGGSERGDGICRQVSLGAHTHAIIHLKNSPGLRRGTKVAVAKADCVAGIAIVVV